MTGKYFYQVENALSGLGVKVNINHAGNIKVTNADPNLRPWEYWTLYESEASENRPMWRRTTMYGYQYPLNMKNRNWKKNKAGWYESRDWNVMECTFNNIDESLEYFIKYYKKHCEKYKRPDEFYSYHWQS